METAPVLAHGVAEAVLDDRLLDGEVGEELEEAGGRQDDRQTSERGDPQLANGDDGAEEPEQRRRVDADRRPRTAPEDRRAHRRPSIGRMEKPAALEHNPGHAGSSRRACGRRRAGGCVSGSGERRRDRSRGLGSALRGERRREHPRPSAGERWVFVVRAVGRHGRAVAASAVVRVLVEGEPVDTIGVFGFRGVLRRSYSWSPTLRGTSAVLEAKVTGPGGKRTAMFPVRVRSVSGRPRFHAAVAGVSRRPQAGQPWSYRRTRDRYRGPSCRRNGGRPRPRRRPGRRHDRLVRLRRLAPPDVPLVAEAAGTNALLQASVVGPGGTRTVGYSVRVR